MRVLASQIKACIDKAESSHSAMSSSPTILTVLLNFRTADMTLQALEAAVRETADMAGAITVVDNDSGDGSYEKIRDGRAREWLGPGAGGGVRSQRWLWRGQQHRDSAWAARRLGTGFCVPPQLRCVSRARVGAHPARRDAGASPMRLCRRPHLRPGRRITTTRRSGFPPFRANSNPPRPRDRSRACCGATSWPFPSRPSR